MFHGRKSSYLPCAHFLGASSMVATPLSHLKYMEKRRRFDRRCPGTMGKSGRKGDRRILGRETYSRLWLDVTAKFKINISGATCHDSTIAHGKFSISTDTNKSNFPIVVRPRFVVLRSRVVPEGRFCYWF